MWPCLDAEETGQDDSSPALDDSLTNLHWLHQLTSQETQCQHPDMSHNTSTVLAAKATLLGMSHIPGKPTLRVTSSPDKPPEDTNYTTEPIAKPPYSYATLICLAMKSSNQSKVTLSTIYSWIRHNYCYYRHAESSWKSSIRHNLSLNKCFLKVPRGMNEPGKGGFWKIDPHYEEQLTSSILKKHQLPPSLSHLLQSKNQVLSLSQASCPEPSDSTAKLLVNVQSAQLLAQCEEVTGAQSWSPALSSSRAAHRPQAVVSTESLSAPVPNSPLLSQEEGEVINSLTGDRDWEAMLQSTLDQRFPVWDVASSCRPGEMSLTINGKHCEALPDCWPLNFDHFLSEPKESNLLVGGAFQKQPWEEGGFWAGGID
ncbi:forkhead box protein J1-A-like [Cetorhinus maximus]